MRLKSWFLILPTFIASPVVAQEWWQHPAVLGPDPRVPVVVREALDYKPVPVPSIHMDVYRPKGATRQLPAVVLIHGGPIPSSLPIEPRQITAFTSLGRLIASHRIVAITFSSRLTDRNAIDTAAMDVHDALAYVLGHASALGVDPGRLCVWMFSAGGVFLGSVLRDYPNRIRCVVSYYNMFTPRLFQDLVGGPEAVPQAAPAIRDLLSRDSVIMPPLFVVRAGQDNPQLNADIDSLVSAILRRPIDLELHAYASGHHGFDFLDDTDASREVLRHTIEFLRAHLVKQ